MRTARPTNSPLADRILRTFLRLVNERGIDATTTRLLAQKAEVNEVTIFRLFGDKAGLLSAAIKRFRPTEELVDYAVAIDASTPDTALVGLVATLSHVRNGMLEHPEFLQFGLAEYWRYPHLKDDIAAAPRAARELVERALVAARPVLRPDIDVRAASLNLAGLLLVSVVWPWRGWIELSEADWQLAATQAVRCLLRD